MTPWLRFTTSMPTCCHGPGEGLFGAVTTWRQLKVIRYLAMIDDDSIDIAEREFCNELPNQLSWTSCGAKGWGVASRPGAG
jgi:hypothetical protein